MTIRTTSSRILVVVFSRSPTGCHPSDSFNLVVMTASSWALRKRFLWRTVGVSLKIWTVLKSLKLVGWAFSHVPFIMVFFTFSHYRGYVWFFVIDAFIKGGCVMGVHDFLTFAQLREWLIGLDLVVLISGVLGPFGSIPARDNNTLVRNRVIRTGLLLSAWDSFKPRRVRIMML